MTKKEFGYLLLTLLASLPVIPPLSAAESRQSPGQYEIIRDVVFGKGGERPLKMNILSPKPRPEEPMPVIVFIFGGAWRTGNRNQGLEPLAPFAARGYFCASIDYRLSQEALFPAQIEDCKCAIRFLRAKAAQYHLDPDRIGVWGLSSGGHLAALLGTSGGVKELEGKGGWGEFSSRVNAVVDCFGPTDFLKLDAAGSQMKHDAPESPESRLIGGPIQQNQAKAALASPITYVSSNAPPFLILHGSQDPLVPVNQSELLAAALEKAKAKVTFEVIPGAGHGFIGGQIDGKIEAFFNQTLKEPKAKSSAVANP
jgi:acetyl esterase/lipase